MNIYVYTDTTVVEATWLVAEIRIDHVDGFKVGIIDLTKNIMPADHMDSVAAALYVASMIAQAYNREGAPTELHMDIPESALGQHVGGFSARFIDRRPFKLSELDRVPTIPVRAGGYEFRTTIGGRWIVPSDEANEWIEEHALEGDVASDADGKLRLTTGWEMCSECHAATLKREAAYDSEGNPACQPCADKERVQ